MNFNIHRLSDTELIAEVNRLARCEREATAQLVAHLAELDARRLYLGAGFSSLFTYCRDVLKLSEQSTYNRIEAARAARRFPVILDMLGEAALNLATVRLLAPHLTPDNHEQLLAAAAHRSKREVEELVARHSPSPRFPPRSGSSRCQSRRSQRSPMRVSRTLLRQKDRLLLPSVHTTPYSRRPQRSRLPRRADQSSGPWQKIDMRSDSRPAPALARSSSLRRTCSATPCQPETRRIVDRALTALLEDLATKKFAATERHRAGGAPANNSRHIPASVKRAVWLRDGGRCAFTSAAGRRCNARGFLEFHHVAPFAAGGRATADNIQLRCRAHNAYEADLYFRSGEFKVGLVRESGATYGHGLGHPTCPGASCARLAQ
jgi:hypothetical protein